MDTINKVMDEYKLALIEKMEAKRAVDNANLALQKAQKRCSLAFSEVIALREL
jgi:hypothetical protein